jgi:hypothetical protein
MAVHAIANYVLLEVYNHLKGSAENRKCCDVLWARWWIVKTMLGVAVHRPAIPPGLCEPRTRATCLVSLAQTECCNIIEALMTQVWSMLLLQTGCFSTPISVTLAVRTVQPQLNSLYPPSMHHVETSWMCRTRGQLFK